jgi:hypothetical protein
MHKLAIAVMATVAIGVMPVPSDAAAHRHGGHHADVRAGKGIAGGQVARRVYVVNGDFDWRRRRDDWVPPWYAHGYSDSCLAWTPHAYHYACDPNSRY